MTTKDYVCVETLIEEIRAEYKEEEKDLEAENKRLLECLEDMEKRLNKLRKSVIVIIDDREEMREELEKAYTRNDELVEKNIGYDEKIKELTKESEELKEDNEDFKERLKEIGEGLREIRECDLDKVASALE